MTTPEITPIPGPKPTPTGPNPLQPPTPVSAVGVVVKHWKTTTAGFLSAFIGTVGPLTAYLATTNNPKTTQICGVLTCAAAIARVWIGLIQQDAQQSALPVVKE